MGATATVAESEALLLTELSTRLGIDRQELDVHERFSRFGLDSVGATGLVRDLSEVLGRPLSSTLIWDYPTISSLSRYLAGEIREEPSRPVSRAAPRVSSEPIAIVGLSCRLPRAEDARAFWRLLAGGVDAITEVPAERWDIEAAYDADSSVPGKMSTRWGGFLEGVDRFDPQFFGISPREAVRMDPQQRLALEVSWEALEDAGIVPAALKGRRTGVFVGAMWSDYAQLTGGDLRQVVQYTATGLDLSIVPGRVSYTLGLRGPSIAVNTACSSSLVAVHMACQSLRLGECSLALAGGVNLILSPYSSVVMSKFGAMSPTGSCKAFDARADGYVRGEGCGMVVLKPFSRALADGDPVYCLIRGSAINNDGFSNGLTAPNPAAQEDVLRDAYLQAGIAPRQVHYVETHGPGTNLGDPIEAKALGAVLGEGRPADQRLRIGSVKTNLGHLEAAAGIAGLIKTCLALRHHQLPPSLHFEKPNPHIPFEDLRLQVQRELTPWPRTSEPRVAGVSSFGFSGTNCHVVLGEVEQHPAFLCPLAADDPEQLGASVRHLDARLVEIEGSGHEVLEICRRAAFHRSRGRYRMALVGRSPEELREGLATVPEATVPEPLDAGRARDGSSSVPRIVFICPGNGGQWTGMGRGLLETEPVFRAGLEGCDRVIREIAGFSVLDELLADEASRATDVVQPLLFSLQVALGDLWRSWGIEPEAVVGHSLGEVAAACLAGILSREEAARVVCLRSRFAQEAAGRGGMAVVGLSAEETQEALRGHGGALSIGAVNSPTSTVITGENEALDAVVNRLREREVYAARVKMDYASHSPQVEPARVALVEALAGLEPRRAHLRMVSTVTGEDVRGPECGPEYWGRNLRQPVRFSRAVGRLLGEGEVLFLELNPHPVLAKAVEEILAHHGAPGRALASLRREADERSVILETLGDLYRRGAEVSWDALLGHGVSSTAARPAEPSPILLPLSARDPEALRAQAAAYRAFLAEEAAPLREVAYTAGVRRGHHEHRLALAASSSAELVAGLEGFLAREPHPGVSSGRAGAAAKRRPVFVFPGQGSQWWGMGRRLLERETVFRYALERCDATIRDHVGWSLLEELRAPEAESRLDEIDRVQPALFSIQVGLAELWRSWGVEPGIVIGHSMGEAAASYVAGALSLEDASRVICLRSRLLRRVSGQGAMALVELALAEAREAIAGRRGLSVAVSNSPTATVLAGEPGALDEVLGELDERGVFCRRIRVDVASHSPQVDPLLDDLVEVLAGLAPRPAKLPLRSTVEGKVLDGTELDAAYWARNLRRPVLLWDAVRDLVHDGYSTFIEISPHPILIPSIEQGLRHLGGDTPGRALPSLRREEDETACLLATLGALYTQGQTVDWRGVYREGGRCVRLPTSSFHRRRYWPEPGDAGEAVTDLTRAAVSEAGETAHPLLGRRLASPLDALQFESRISTECPSYLAEHTLFGRVVVPGAYYVAALVAAAEEALGLAVCTVDGLEFRSALALAEGEVRTVQLILSPEDSGEVACRVAGLGGDGEWTVHCTGRLRLGAQENGENPALRKTRQDLREELSEEEVYHALEGAGYAYGPGFRGIRRVDRRDGGLLGVVEVPESLGQADRNSLHPSLLDACFQLLCLAGIDAMADTEDLFVPFALDRLTYHGRREEGALRCHVRPRRHGLAGDPRDELLVGDLRLTEPSGRSVAEIRGLHMKRTSRQRLLGRRTRRADLEGLYRMRWSPIAEAAPERRQGSWLILADRGGLGQALAARIEKDGAGCRLLAADEPDELVVERLAEMPSPLTGIVHLRGLDAAAAGAAADEEAESPLAAQERVCGSVLELLQALAERGVLDGGVAPPRLWLVTRGAQAVTGDAFEPIAIAQSPLWGLGSVLALEHPELATTRVDLDPLGERRARIDAGGPSTVQALWSELRSGTREDQVAWRDGRRYGARLVPVTAPSFAGDGERFAPPLVLPEAQPYRLEVGEPGLVSSLRAVPLQRRPPAPGEVEIEVRESGLNFRDVLSALGKYPGEAGPPGLECAGEVVRAGSGSGDLNPGDRVMAFAPGSFSSFVTVSADLVAPLPARLGFEEAATLPVNFLTALFALDTLAAMAAGDTVLIHSASGGVGLAALQLARRTGAKVFATAGSARKRRFLAARGVHAVLDSRSLDFADEVEQATRGLGVDVVVNSLPGEYIAKGLGLLKPGGRFVELGKNGIWDAEQVAALCPDVRYFTVDLVDLAASRPELIRGLLRDLVAGLESGELQPLPRRRFDVSQTVDAFRLMAGAGHIGKIVLGDGGVGPRAGGGEDQGGDEPAFKARGDATHLVTGGLGGIGLELSRWLVARGARHLALLGRSRPDEAALAAVEELRSSGAEVLLLRADVADRQSLAAALDEIEHTTAPLGSVFHAAGILADGVLREQTWERFRPVLDSKVAGAWNLDRLTRGRRLDHFVLFSSVTGLLGSPGQGNYAAGNAFLDALAHDRRARGLPALAVNWGPWAKVGLAAAHSGRGERLAARGLGSLEPGDGLETLGRLLDGDEVRACCMRFDPAAWRRSYPWTSRKGWASELSPVRPAMAAGREEEAARHEPVKDLRQRLLETRGGPARRTLLESELRHEAAQVLRLAPAQVDPEIPLRSLGLDSLTSLELKNRLEARLGLTLSTSVIWNYPTLSALADFLASQLGVSLDRETAAQRTAADAAAGARRDEIESLAEDEAELLLTRKLASLGKKVPG